MKIANTLREFKKIKRKYYKQNSVKRYWTYNGKRRISYWMEKDFVGYLVTTSDMFKSLCVNNELDTYVSKPYLHEAGYFLTHLLELLRNNQETGVRVLNGTKEYSFYGFLLTNRDIYYYVFDKEQMQYFLLTFANEIELTENINEKN